MCASMAPFFFSSRRRHTRWNCDWSSDVCSSDLRARRCGRGDGGVPRRSADSHRCIWKIGRASCRERVEIAVGGVIKKKKKKKMEVVETDSLHAARNTVRPELASALRDGQPATSG